MSAVTVCRTRGDLRAALAGAGRPLHLVPTMGALHAGHAALLRAAREAGATVVMSLFVNPLQFDDPGDLARYPRALEHDREIAAAEGVDVIWFPHVAEMYPGGSPAVTVHVGGVGDGLEGVQRPGHFHGVATVVSKLFHQVACDAAWFGRKDAQQVAVVRRMVADLDFAVEVREHPTVREPDGLALSSRNALLAPEARRDATRLSAGLFRAADLAEGGERDARLLEAACGPGLEYAALVDAASFAPVPRLEQAAVLAVAARVGEVRLIDNVSFTPEPGGNFRADRGILLEAAT